MALGGGVFPTQEVVIVISARDQATAVMNKVGTTLKNWAPALRAVSIGTAAMGGIFRKLGQDTERLGQANANYLTTLEKTELAIGKVLQPISDLSSLMFVLAGIYMMLSWKAGRWVAIKVTETLALAAGNVAMRIATARNVAYTVSVEAMTAAVTLFVAALAAVAVVVVAGLMLWQASERRKLDAIKKTNDAIKEQADLLMSELEKLKSDQEKTWDAATEAAETAYDTIVTKARATYGDIEEMDTSLMAVERDRYDAEIDAIDLKYSKIIEGYNIEMGLLDKASEDSQRAYQDAADADTIAHLEALKSVAMTEAEKAKLTDDINETIADRAQRWAEQTTDDKRAQLAQNIIDAQKSAEDEKAVAKTTSEGILSDLNAAGLKMIADAKTIWDKAISDAKTEKDTWLKYYDELSVKVQSYIDLYNDVNEVVHYHIQDLRDINTEYDKLLPKVNAMSIQGGATTQAMIPAGRTLSYTEMQHLYRDDNSYANGMQRYTAAWLASMKGKVAMTPELANQLGDMSGFKMASGGSGVVTKPTTFLAGDAGPEAFAFAPLGSAGGSASGGTTYIDNRKISIGSWLGNRQGIEELVDRLQPVMRTRERWGTGKARY
jgi:hypothetical protein